MSDSNERRLWRARLIVTLMVGAPLLFFAGLVLDDSGHDAIGIPLAVAGVAILAGGRLHAYRWKQRGGQTTVPVSPPVAAAQEAPLGPALEVAATRSYERSQRRTYRYLWMFGLAALIGFVVVAALSEDHADDLVNHGGQVAGVVEGYARSGALNLDHDPQLLVAYAVSGVPYDEKVQLDDNSPAYQIGQQVTVYYNKSRPADMTIPGQDNQPAWSVTLFVMLLVLGLLFLIVGIQGAHRARIRRSVLAVASWHAGSLTTVDGNHLTVDGRMFRVSGAKAYVTRTFVPGPVWLAADPDGPRAVVAQVGGTRSLLAKAPRQPA